jgi:hypothetical protein
MARGRGPRQDPREGKSLPDRGKSSFGAEVAAVAGDTFWR